MRDLKEKFITSFNEEAEFIYRVPARINLIGEHIDYNGGYVLPAAISCYIKALVSRREDSILSAYSLNIGDKKSIDINEIKKGIDYSWCNYVFGIFYILKHKGYVLSHGLNILINSEIPLGSGLSSSAALLDLIAFIANDIFTLGISLKDIALIAQETENSFCWVKSGIMDEAAIALGKKDKCLLLDCAKYQYKYIDLDLGEYAFVVMKSNVPRSLATSKYNDRVDECTKGLNILKKEYKIDNLCQLNISDLPHIQELIVDPTLYKRIRHVINEKNRVDLFIEALKEKDIASLGRILCESHQSLKNDYEVTGEYLDTITDSAMENGAFGARMTGAGFGGCAIALIKRKDFDSFKKKVEEKYYLRTNIKGECFLIDIVDGPRKEI